LAVFAARFEADYDAKETDLDECVSVEMENDDSRRRTEVLKRLHFYVCVRRYSLFVFVG